MQIDEVFAEAADKCDAEMVESLVVEKSAVDCGPLISLAL